MAPDPRTALCPGTFDPVTNGHLDVIARASSMYDHVIVSVVNLPWRKGKTLFTAEERVAFVENATRDLANIKVLPFAALLVDFAREQGAMAIVKGLRAISDFEYEFEMNQLNRMQAADVDTLYLMAGPQYSFLSSSGVKEIATFGGDIDALVPPTVARRLHEELNRSRS